MPKAFCSQAKRLIANVVDYFEQESENLGPLLPVNCVRERASNALSVSLRSVDTVIKEVKDKGTPHSPKRMKLRGKPVRDIDDFDKVAIRNIMYEMCAEKKHITLQNLLEKLSEGNIYRGGRSTLGKILKDIGFRYKKDDPRRGLMELPRIVISRVNFLEKFMKNLRSPNPLQCVFLDETWVFQNGTICKSWHDNSTKSLRNMKGEGKRYIILHAGCEKGFIDGASKIFVSGLKLSDYHGEMNAESFLNWFENQLLNSLEEPSIIIMDNASYHSMLKEKIPNSSWKKQDIQTWLADKGINTNVLLKIQLLDLVQQNKPPKTYIIDEMAEMHGHQVLRLPPYHCIFNPIEHIWGITKTFYNKNIGQASSSTTAAIETWQKALSTITPDIWRSTVRHTTSVIEEWWNREIGFDREEMEPFIINVGDSSSSGDDSDSNT